MYPAHLAQWGQTDGATRYYRNQIGGRQKPTQTDFPAVNNHSTPIYVRIIGISKEYVIS